MSLDLVFITMGVTMIVMTMVLVGGFGLWFLIRRSRRKKRQTVDTKSSMSSMNQTGIAAPNRGLDTDVLAIDGPARGDEKTGNRNGTAKWTTTGGKPGAVSSKMSNTDEAARKARHELRKKKLDERKQMIMNNKANPEALKSAKAAHDMSRNLRILLSDSPQTKAPPAVMAKTKEVVDLEEKLRSSLSRTSEISSEARSNPTASRTDLSKRASVIVRF